MLSEAKVIKAVMMFLWSWEHFQFQSSTKHLQVGGLCWRLRKEVHWGVLQTVGLVSGRLLEYRSWAELEGYEWSFQVRCQQENPCRKGLCSPGHTSRVAGQKAMALCRGGLWFHTPNSSETQIQGCVYIKQWMSSSQAASGAENLAMVAHSCNTSTWSRMKSEGNQSETVSINQPVYPSINQSTHQSGQQDSSTGKSTCHRSYKTWIQSLEPTRKTEQIPES